MHVDPWGTFSALFECGAVQLVDDGILDVLVVRVGEYGLLSGLPTVWHTARAQSVFECPLRVGLVVRVGHDAESAGAHVVLICADEQWD